MTFRKKKFKDKRRCKLDPKYYKPTHQVHHYFLIKIICKNTIQNMRETKEK